MGPFTHKMTPYSWKLGGNEGWFESAVIVIKKKEFRFWFDSLRCLFESLSESDRIKYCRLKFLYCKKRTSVVCFVVNNTSCPLLCDRC